MKSRGELISLVVIALAILFGGAALLYQISHAGRFSIIALVLLAFFQIVTLRRNFRERTAFARLLVTRDIIFIVAIGCAIAFVASPARWSSGATVAAVEFGLLMEVLARLGPSNAPSATADGPLSEGAAAEPENPTA